MQGHTKQWRVTEYVLSGVGGERFTKWGGMWGWATKFISKMFRVYV